MKRVVITGLGTVNPLGSTVEKFWENIKKGTLGVSKIDSFDTTELGVSVAGIIRDFDPAEYFDRKDIRHMERFHADRCGICHPGTAGCRHRL